MVHSFLKFYLVQFQELQGFHYIHILLFLVSMFDLYFFHNYLLLNFLGNLLYKYFHIFFYLHNMVLFFQDNRLFLNKHSLYNNHQLLAFLWQLDGFYFKNIYYLDLYDLTHMTEIPYSEPCRLQNICNEKTYFFMFIYLIYSFSYKFINKIFIN